MERTRKGEKDIRTGSRIVKLEAKARIIRALALSFLTVDIVFHLLSKLLFWVGWINFSFNHPSFEGTWEIIHALYIYTIVGFFIYKQLPLGILLLPLLAYNFLGTGAFLSLSAFSNTGFLLLFSKVWLVNYALTALFLILYVLFQTPLLWLRYKEKRLCKWSRRKSFFACHKSFERVEAPV